ncbi:MAG: class I SAM-dependent methyltransferase [Propionibacteriaceae bacterium]|nr:class I SAM-dependent methyltransferase [Propionibacteriaceae bacterium]
MTDPASLDDLHIVNKAHWDEVAELHRASYDTESLLASPEALSSVVTEDARLLEPFLPDVAGLDLLHLQCHIGTDSLSWARLGARVTGLDLSSESLQVARDLASQADCEIEYIESSIEQADRALKGRQFDVVYTSIGVICWLENLDQWAALIASVLRPGGVFFIRDHHPVAAALEYEGPPGELRLTWPYFNTGPLVCDSDADYSSPEPVKNGRTIEWAHSMAEVIGSLLRAGLTIRDFQEHKMLPWLMVPWMEQDGDSYVLPAPLRDICPLTFSLVATKD